MSDPIEVLGDRLQTVAACTSPEAASAAARLLGGAWLRAGSSSTRFMRERLAEGEGEIVRLRQRVFELEVDLDEARRNARELSAESDGEFSRFLACAEAAGVVVENDCGPILPGPVEKVVEEIRRYAREAGEVVELREHVADLEAELADVRADKAYVLGRLDESRSAVQEYCAEIDTLRAQVSAMHRRAQEAERLVGLAMRVGLAEVERLGARLFDAGLVAVELEAEIARVRALASGTPWP